MEREFLYRGRDSIFRINKQIMNDSSLNKYVSLKAAAELYGYTRDHLGLMIRQGKLNGIKLGSYYVTTNEWMVEYIKNFAALNHSSSKNKLSNKFLAGVLSSKKDLAPVTRNAPKTSRNNIIRTAKIVKEKVQKYDTDNSLKEILLEELSRYANPSGAGIAPGVKTDQSEQSIQVARAENSISAPFDAPYVILPVRKMENTEREEILRKAS